MSQSDSSVSKCQYQALKQILQSYAVSSEYRIDDIIKSISLILGCDGEETLRDKFAMAVLQGYISCDPTGSAFWKTIPQMQDAAKRAYEWAAVMMEARK